jgi:hypothetical protein
VTRPGFVLLALVLGWSSLGAAQGDCNRRVEVDLDRLVVFGGATWELTERLGLTGELYAAPTDAITGRVIVRTAIGP